MRQSFESYFAVDYDFHVSMANWFETDHTTADACKDPSAPLLVVVPLIPHQPTIEQSPTFLTSLPQSHVTSEMMRPSM